MTEYIVKKANPADPLYLKSTVGIKFQTRFGMFGSWMYLSDENDIDLAKRKLSKVAERQKRRHSGKNGWLWYKAERLSGENITMRMELKLLHMKWWFRLFSWLEKILSDLYTSYYGLD